MKNIVMAAPLAALMLITVSAQANARRCDGFHGCRCGVTAARDHGLPLDYHGLNLKMAASYYAFPRTTCHAGAIGIPHAHHVYTVVQCNGDGTATVHDDAGTYRRRVAGNVFVDASGNVAERRQPVMHVRHHRHVQLATYSRENY